MYGVGTNVLAKTGGTYKAQDGVTNPLDSLSEYEYAKNTTNTNDPRGTMSTYGAAYIPEKEMDSLMGVWNKHKKNVKQTYNQFNSAKSEDFENLSLEDLWKKRNVARNQVLDEAESTNTEARAVPMRMITDQIRGAREKYLPEEEQVSNYYSKQIDSLASSYSNYDNISKQIMLQKEKESGLSEEELTKRWKEVTQNQDGGNTIKKMTPFKEYLKKYPKADTLRPPGLVLDRRYQTGQRDDLNQAFQDTYSNYLPDWERFDTENNGVGPGIRRTNNNPPPQKNGGFYKAQGGGMFTGEYMPLVDPNQQKQFKLGGILGSNSYLVPKALDGVSYGGGQEGSIGTNIAYMSGVEQDAGSRIGSKIGSTAGSIFGPPGALIGGYLGTAVGGILDKDGDAIRRHQRAEEKNLKEMAFNSMAPAIQANYASYVKNGGEIQSMRSGGNMRGNYVPPNPSALDTMAMGGDVKTLWGGKAETVSYNPYAGGESIEFKGNSHSYRDPKTGETGIGVAYGDNAVNNNEPSVEVENEPAQKLKQGGEEENLVVYGDMYIPDNLVPLIQDDKAKGKKFKNYVSNVLNPQESKVNKRQEKVADLGLESDDTAIGQLERNTADIVLKGSDMKLKSIAEKKNILAELQNVMNETFDQFEIDANKFIKKGEMVKDPMRMENSEVAKYGKRVIKAQTGITTDDFDTKQIPKTDMTEEELKSEGYVREGDSNIFIKRDGENVEAVESSGSSLGYTPEGQSANESGTYGNTTQKDVDAIKENNTWFKGDIDLKKEPVTFKGQFVNPDVLRFQQEFNKRIKGTDIKPIKVDGRFGEETKTARYTAPVEGKKAVEEKVMLEQPKTTVESTTVAPEQLSPMVNFQRPIDDIPLGTDQLLGEYYALATNQVQPVQAQSFQPRLRVPYDISLQDMRNDLTSQSRMLERNPALQNNPAALAMMQAPLYDARNKINAEEFRQNQVMKDSVYSGNLEAINKAKMINLGLYDQQADRQAQAVANTRSQNIDALQSIGNKRAQNIRDNAMMKTYANMYPSFRFDRNYQAQVQPTGYSPFNIPGQGNTLNPIGMASNISGNPNIANYLNLVNQLGQFTNKNKQATTEEETTEQGSGKYGKKVTRNNRNSNILRELRNL